MFHPGPARKLSTNAPIWEIGASGWFYYKEICYDARSHECKIRSTQLYNIKITVLCLTVYRVCISGTVNTTG